MPTNRLLLELILEGHNAVTLEKFQTIDKSKYDIVIFDEIYFHSVYNMMLIKKFCDNTNIIIGCTGDLKQLKPVEFGCNNYEYKTYVNFCINQLFPYTLNLKIPKRVEKDEHKKLLMDIYEDLFIHGLSAKQVVYKYFKNKITNTITTCKNVCYTNDLCGIVSNIVRKNMGLPDELQIGEIITCRSHLYVKKYRYRVNYDYEIIEIKNNNITVKSLGENIVSEISASNLKTHFISSFASTCHSYQGRSESDAITIFGWKAFYVDANWIWTAITRARNLDNVYFYDDKDCDSEIAKQTLFKYAQKKIQGYKTQDKQAGREFDTSNYVTPQNIINCIGKSCECDAVFWFNGTNSNITMDRIDEELPHSASNCRPLCDYCNKTRKQLLKIE